MRTLAPLLLLLLTLPALAYAQASQPYIYTGTVYILEKTGRGLALVAETPVTVSYWPQKRLVDINHGIAHPALASLLKRVLATPFAQASPEGEARVDVVYLAQSTRSLYLCREALASSMPGGTVYLDLRTLVPVAAEYVAETQGLLVQVSLQLSVSPEPLCGTQITSPAKMALIGGLALAIVAGAFYTFASWRSRVAGLWTPAY